MTGDRHGNRHEQGARPQAMPEYKGQCKGENNGAVIAWERVIRCMVQEVVADVVNKRTIVREQMSYQP